MSGGLSDLLSILIDSEMTLIPAISPKTQADVVDTCTCICVYIGVIFHTQSDHLYVTIALIRILIITMDMVHVWPCM